MCLCHTVQVAGKIEIEGITDGIENKFLNLDEESDMSDNGQDDNNRASVKYTFIGIPSGAETVTAEIHSKFIVIFNYIIF